MPAKELLRYRCGDCNVTFERTVLSGHFPDKGCPKCHELPQDYETVAAWWENARGPAKGRRIYSFGGPEKRATP